MATDFEQVEFVRRSLVSLCLVARASVALKRRLSGVSKAPSAASERRRGQHPRGQE